ELAHPLGVIRITIVVDFLDSVYGCSNDVAIAAKRFDDGPHSTPEIIIIISVLPLATRDEPNKRSAAGVDPVEHFHIEASVVELRDRNSHVGQIEEGDFRLEQRWFGWREL